MAEMQSTGDETQAVSGAEHTRTRSAELFRALDDPTRTDGSRREVRDELVRLHLPLVQHCARRFRNRGEPHDDLLQVGTIGLIKAVDRFDPTRGVEFSTYATPNVIGEIKRHFRDTGWAIRVPRRLQELRIRINACTGDLTQTLGRSPTADELAGRIGCSVEAIVEALESNNAYSTFSLDAGSGSGDGPAAMLETLGGDDDAILTVDLRESIKPLIEQLSPREKQILMLRFFAHLTQTEIADQIGVSQMHVSRLLNRALESMRTALAQAD